jgi:hypothetical protein
VFEKPELKAAYDAAMQRMQKDKRVNTLKASKALETVKDKKAVAKLGQIQDQQLQKLGGIDGDWLVLGDCSGSMHTAVEVAKHVSALIAQQVKGKVHLIFFNSRPVYIDVTGMSWDEIKEKTKRITASGMTSCGCGIDYLSTKRRLLMALLSVLMVGITLPLCFRMHTRSIHRKWEFIPLYITTM